jgi:hypothetical protein
MRLTIEPLAAFSWNYLQLRDDFSMPFFYDRLMKKSSFVVVVLAIVAPLSLAPARVNPAVDSGRTLEANLLVPRDIAATLHREDFLGPENIPSRPYFSVKLEAGARRRWRSACVHSMTLTESTVDNFTLG